MDTAAIIAVSWVRWAFVGAKVAFNNERTSIWKMLVF